MSNKLHLICGMCGCSDRWTYKIEPEGTDIDGVQYPDCYIYCENCGTLHTLDEANAKMIIEVDGEERTIG